MYRLCIYKNIMLHAQGTADDDKDAEEKKVDVYMGKKGMDGYMECIVI